MSPSTVAFLLMLVTHPGDSLALTKMQSYANRTTCQTAAQTINVAIGSTDGVVVLCVPTSAIEALERSIH